MDQDNAQNFLNIKYWTIWHWWISLTFIYFAFFVALALGIESILSINILTQAIFIILTNVINFIGLFVPIGFFSVIGIGTPIGIGTLTVSILLFFSVYFFSRRLGLVGWKLAIVNLLALFIATFLCDLNWISECFWPSMQLFITGSQCVDLPM